MTDYDRYVEQIASLIAAMDPDMDVAPGTANYDFVVKPNALVAAMLYGQISETVNNMSVTQVLSSDDPNEDLVDLLLSNLRVTQRDSSLAVGYVSVVFTGTANVSIPSSAIFTVAGIQLNPRKTYVLSRNASDYADTEDTSFIQAITYEDGTNVGVIGVSSASSFAGTLSPGQACTFTLTDPRVRSITVASTISGNEAETNAELLAKAVAGVSATVLTGADNIRNFYLNSDAYPVRDAAVFGMGSEVMTRDKESTEAAGGGGSVDVYVRTDETPQLLSLDLTATRVDGSETAWETDIPSDIVPGAIAVTSLFKGTDKITGYSLTCTARTNVTYPRITKSVDARYSKYQETKLTFEYPYLDDSITTLVVKAEVMYVAGIDLLQDVMEDPDVRSNAFDVLTKAGIPLNTSMKVSVKYPSGSSAPTASTLQTAIATAVNALPIGTRALYTSIVSAAVLRAFPGATVVMPIHMDAAVYMPDGSVLYAHSTDALQAPTASGISYANTMFVCYPGSVAVTLMEE